MGGKSAHQKDLGAFSAHARVHAGLFRVFSSPCSDLFRLLGALPVLPFRCTLAAFTARYSMSVPFNNGAGNGKKQGGHRHFVMLGV